MLLKSNIIAFIILIIFNAKGISGLSTTEISHNFNTFNILNALANTPNNSTCYDHIYDYLRNITSRPWAQRMFDSSAKIPDGLFIGNLKFLGHFDECLNVEDKGQNFTGQYTLLSLLQQKSDDKNDTNNELIQTFGAELAPGYFMSFYYALCLPSTCEPYEIENGMNSILNQTIQGAISVELKEENCWTKDKSELNRDDWIVIGFVVAVVVIALISTIYDVYQRQILKNSKPHPFLASFSIYTNGKFLFHISESSGQLKALHGIRTLSMCWVVLCHAYMYIINGSIVNLLDGLLLTQDKKHIPIINGFVSVDTFFFLSGLLVCFVFFRDISKKGSFDVPLSYIHRYLRLTPLYAVMILFQVTILVHLNRGPLWHIVNDPAKSTCMDNWWSGLVYVQNYISPSSTCLGQTWYLSADMQMFWVSPFILYPLLFWPAFAPFLLIILILAAAFTNFAIAYVNNLGPSQIRSSGDKQFSLDYAPFHTRMAPWLIGLTTGYIICGIQAKKIQIELSKLWILVGWLASTGLCLGALYGIIPFLGNQEYTEVEAAFYLAFHRVMWGLGLAWIVFACVQGYGGIINDFLSWNVFQPLGKLSYAVFLTHISVQNYRVGIQRTSAFLGDFEMTYYFLGDLIIAHLVSIPLCLLFEIPFGNLDRYFFSNVKILPFPRSKKLGKQKPAKVTSNINNEKSSNSDQNNDENDSSIEFDSGKENHGFENETASKTQT